MPVIAPDDLSKVSIYDPHLFLAGSIEQDRAPNWQAAGIRFFTNNVDLKNLVIVNPRRASWDPTLEQTIANPIFKGQVVFELERLERADAVVMWLEPGTLSPISLLELGLLCGWSSSGNLNKLVVGCPQGFWRKGNVDVVCERYKVKVVDTQNELFEEGKILLERNFDRRMTNNNATFSASNIR